MSSPTVSSAEWIAEAPSRCVSSSSQDCHILSLADFGSVTFTGASARALGLLAPVNHRSFRKFFSNSERTVVTVSGQRLALAYVPFHLAHG
jgi:hypothetical protein